MPSISRYIFIFACAMLVWLGSRHTVIQAAASRTLAGPEAIAGPATSKLFLPMMGAGSVSPISEGFEFNQEPASDEPAEGEPIKDEPVEDEPAEEPPSSNHPSKPSEPSEPKFTLCPELNEMEGELAHVMYTHARQQRLEMKCHPILTEAAQAKAEDMAVRDYFGHETPEGIGPNRWVLNAGYPLPDFYGGEKDANSIESIAAGTGAIDDVWATWMSFEMHRTHLLGLEPFFAEQVQYGIGYAYAPDSDYQHYWVVLTAPVFSSTSAAVSSSVSLFESSTILSSEE